MRKILLMSFLLVMYSCSQNTNITQTNKPKEENSSENKVNVVNEQKNEVKQEIKEKPIIQASTIVLPSESSKSNDVLTKDGTLISKDTGIYTNTKITDVVPSNSPMPTSVSPIATEPIPFPSETKLPDPYKVPEDARDGEVYILFKDEYFVRLDKSSTATGLKLTSSTQQEQVKIVEKILIDYGVKELINNFPEGEDGAKIFEKIMEDDCKCDYSNPLSGYTIIIKNQNIIEMVAKLKASPIVRKINYYDNDKLS